MMAFRYRSFFRPFLHKALIGRRVESHDLKWNTLVNDQAMQKQLHSLCHGKTEPMKDFFGRVLHAWSDAHL